MENYPSGPNKVLGFLDWQLLLTLEFDHIYTSAYFLGLCVLLAASITACSRTQQWPLLKIAQRWQFPKRATQVFAKGNGTCLRVAAQTVLAQTLCSCTLPKRDACTAVVHGWHACLSVQQHVQRSTLLPCSLLRSHHAGEHAGETIDNVRVQDLAAQLRSRKYSVFLRGGALYAFKGMAGRLAPIFVHISLLAVLGGGAYGALAGFDGQVMLPEGGEFLTANVLRGAGTAIPGMPLPGGANKVVKLERFIIDYRPDGSIGQYRSILSRQDLNGRPDGQKEIHVNEPMRYGGVTLYQVRGDWDCVLRVRQLMGASAFACALAPCCHAEVLWYVYTLLNVVQVKRALASPW